MRAPGAGVANMGWGFPNAMYQNPAQAIQETHKTHRKKPASITEKLRIADVASYALVLFENPDGFISIPAGNEASNNDQP